MDNLFDKACKYAIEKHSNQKRKDGSIYILHPFEVATIASTITNDEEVLSAAILHDCVEDTDSNIDEIYDLFGERISKLVENETEPVFPDLSKEESWKLRKKCALERLDKTTDIGFKIIYLSDKLSNIRSLYRDYRINGNEAFNKFNVKDIDTQSWFYHEVLKHLKELNEYDAYKELEEKIDIIFNK